MDSKFIAQMEKVLSTYELPYNEEYPVISFDERPCQLIDNIVEPIGPAPGMDKKIDYAYRRNGVCAVLMAIEPLTGKRIVEVVERRTKKEYTEFMQKVSKAYPKAKKIKLVQDNLNTHSPSSFYANLAPDKAFALMERFEMIFTPRKASWLNIIEIEFSALSRQCLDRRIGKLEELTNEVLHWTEERNQKKVKITWQFTRKKAREKLGRRYKNVQNF